MEKKMTKKEMFGAIIELANEKGRTDIVDFANHEIELLERKASRSTQTKTQKENEIIMYSMYTVLETIGRTVTITELQNENSEIANYQNQKISALLKKMTPCECPKVVTITEKNTSYFSIVEYNKSVKYLHFFYFFVKNY